MPLSALLRHSTYAFSRCYSTSSTASPPPYRIFFCGSDGFAKTIANALLEAKDVCSEIRVLTARNDNTWKSRKRYYSSPVKDWAELSGVDHDFAPQQGLKEYRPSYFEPKADNDLLITASFGHLIPTHMLQYFPPKQQLNLHPSLLPDLSGAAPIQWAIARQLDRTGVSVQTLGERFDSGDILAQQEVAIPALVNYDTLEQILAQQGSQLLVKVLRDLPTFAARARSQSDVPLSIIPSRAPKLKPALSQVQWNRWTADEIAARHRAFSYLFPLRASLSQLTSASILLREVEAIDDISNLYLSPLFIESEQSGVATYSPQTRSILVKCKGGQSYLSITRLQSEGKQEMEASSWIIGYRSRKHQDKLMQFDV